MQCQLANPDLGRCQLHRLRELQVRERPQLGPVSVPSELGEQRTQPPEVTRVQEAALVVAI
eukprot:8553302-Pyramimonas_sp.AAC.1